MRSVTIYTDGSCLGNPGHGGWGAILSDGKTQKEISGGCPETTNNRMELTAAIAALSELKYPCSVSLYSDSKYLIDGMKSWIDGWKKRGWKKADKTPVLNADLWAQLDQLRNIHTIQFIWVKGHASNEFNNRCDEMAVSQAKKQN